MKKINCLILSLTLIIFANNCSGYKPIFSTQSIEFKIVNHFIEGDKMLGKNIYSKFYHFLHSFVSSPKLYNSFKSSEDGPALKSVNIFIKTSKDKKATSKNSAGKILEYRISLNTEIKVKDYVTDNEILNQTFIYTSTYKVQDQYSDTLKLENQSTQNLIDKTYQEILIKISQNITKK